MYDKELFIIREDQRNRNHESCGTTPSYISTIMANSMKIDPTFDALSVKFVLLVVRGAEVARAMNTKHA